MPRRSSNTKRGSQVALNKRKKQEEWRELLQAKLLSPSLSLAQHELSKSTAQDRWNKLQQARAAGKSEEEALSFAATNHSGGHNRAFQPEHEALLGAMVAAASPSLTHSQIQDQALQLQQSIHLASHSSHLTRSPTASSLLNFHASDGWVSGFKGRQRLSSHRTAIKFTSRPEKERDMEGEKNNFIREVKEAIDKYGPARVLNMDEVR